MTDIADLVASLLATEPQLRFVHAHHVADNDELLSHLFMADVTRWLCTRGPSPRVLQVLEVHFETGDPDVQDVIRTSVLENLERGDSQHQRVLGALGPRLTAALRAMDDRRSLDLGRPT